MIKFLCEYFKGGMGAEAVKELLKNIDCEKEVEEFREVLYTLKEVEVAGWIRSLQLRGIELPDALKDEAFLILGERRIHA